MSFVDRESFVDLHDLTGIISDFLVECNGILLSVDVFHITGVPTRVPRDL